MPETWFAGDHHFGHVRINELAQRPFGSIEEADEIMIERHNERVEPKDHVWLVGDVCLGPIEESLAKLARLNGHLVLLSGNHDRTFAGYNGKGYPDKSVEWTSRYRDAVPNLRGVVTGRGFARSKIPITIPIGLGLSPVQVWHFPRHGDPIEGDRYDEWRPPRPKADALPWLIHGHTHSPVPFEPDKRQIHVGVDAWDFRPVHLEEVQGLIRSAS